MSEMNGTIPRKDVENKLTNDQNHFLNNSPSSLFDGRNGTLLTGNLALKEEIIGGKTDTVKGEGKTAIEINCFMGNDPSAWKRNISASVS